MRLQAIDHPHGEISIQTGFTVKDGRVHLRISDNGRGVAPAIADRIFLPFVTDKQSQGGTGLGLSVSYSLVKAHGGEIGFENRAVRRHDVHGDAAHRAETRSRQDPGGG